MGVIADDYGLGVQVLGCGSSPYPKQGYPNIDPKCYSPYNREPRQGILNCGKPQLGLRVQDSPHMKLSQHIRLKPAHEVCGNSG